MGRVADPALASLWRDRVQSQQRSGLSIAGYCRREGFSAASFHAWKRRLGVSRRPARKSRHQGGRGAAADRLAQGGFVRVPLAVESAFEVHFADGTMVRVAGERLSALEVALKTLHGPRREGTADD